MYVFMYVIYIFLRGTYNSISNSTCMTNNMGTYTKSEVALAKLQSVISCDPMEMMRDFFLSKCETWDPPCFQT